VFVFLLIRFSSGQIECLLQAAFLSPREQAMLGGGFVSYRAASSLGVFHAFFILFSRLGDVGCAQVRGRQRPSGVTASDPVPVLMLTP
jgi:hypothetical protein